MLLSRIVRMAWVVVVRLLVVVWRTIIVTRVPGRENAHANCGEPQLARGTGLLEGEVVSSSARAVVGRRGVPQRSEES